MFLFERLFGIGCYVLLLLIAEVFLLHSRARLSRIFFWYTAALCIMAACYLPYKTADLYRILEIVDYYGTLGWGQMVQQQLSTSLSPASVLIYWLFGRAKLGWLLPSCSCLVCYGILFYVIRDASARFSASRRDVALVVYFVMSSGIYMPAIAGIRMMSALSVLLWCFYRIWAAGRIRLWHGLLVFFALTIHTMAIVVTAIACAAFWLVPKGKRGWKLVLAILAMGTVVFVLYKARGHVAAFLREANYHLREDDYFEAWEYGIGWISAWACFSIVRRMGCHQRDTLVFFRYLAALCLTAAAVFAGSFSLFHRLAVETCAIMILPTAIGMLSLEKGETGRVARSNLFIKCTLLLLLNAGRGSLSALKFFEL